MVHHQQEGQGKVDDGYHHKGYGLTMVLGEGWVLGLVPNGRMVLKC